MSEYQTIFDVIILVWMIALTFIKGRKGDRGFTGAQGPKGDKGEIVYVEVKDDK